MNAGNMIHWLLKRVSRDFLLDLSLRALLAAVLLSLENVAPFRRVIRPEEAWLHGYPMTDSYVPSWFLWSCVFSLTGACVVHGWLRMGRDHALSTFMAASLAIGLNGIITDTLKIAVGRPRPDFLQRCYGITSPASVDLGKPCSGPHDWVTDGRKSFPSGHSSYAFMTGVFVSLHLYEQFAADNNRGGGARTTRLLVLLAPLAAAALVAVSRTCDYHHHWQDVLVGALLGTLVAIVSYGQYCQLPVITAAWRQPSQLASPGNTPPPSALNAELHERLA